MSEAQAASRRAIHAKLRAHLRYNVSVAAAILAVSLGLGMAGYHTFANQPWIDAFVDASMILAGMGQVSPLQTDGAKLFAGTYAIYCGVVFIATVGLMLAPVVTHALHKFHLQDRD